MGQIGKWAAGTDWMGWIGFYAGLLFFFIFFSFAPWGLHFPGPNDTMRHDPSPYHDDFYTYNRVQKGREGDESREVHAGQTERHTS